MALYELAAIGKCWGESMVNRFHYMTPNPGTLVGGAQDLADVFVSQVLVLIRVAQKDSLGQLSWDTVTVRDLYDPTDFGEVVAIGQTGTHGSASQAAPPFVATAYRSPRYRTGRNRAYKRIAGIPEAMISGNTYTDLGGIASVQAALISQLVGPVTGNALLPQLLFLESSGGISPTYSYFATEALQRANRALINQMDFVRLTTQRSRIQGHGS